MTRAGLDANVLVSAAISSRGAPGQLMEAWYEGRFMIVISDYIVDEVARAFSYPRVGQYLKWSDAGRDLFISRLRALCILVHPTTPEGVVDDPNDIAILDAARSGQADYVVSVDNALLRVSNYEGIEIVTPRRFLTILEVI